MTENLSGPEYINAAAVLYSAAATFRSYFKETRHFNTSKSI